MDNHIINLWLSIQKKFREAHILQLFYNFLPSPSIITLFQASFSSETTNHQFELVTNQSSSEVVVYEI